MTTIIDLVGGLQEINFDGHSPGKKTIFQRPPPGEKRQDVSLTKKIKRPLTKRPNKVLILEVGRSLL